jgi:hypothetical protein
VVPDSLPDSKPSGGESSEPATPGPSPPASLSRPSVDAEPVDRSTRIRTEVGRAAQVFLGLFSIGFAVVVLATLETTLPGLLLLLGETVVVVSAQTLLAGGRVISENWLRLRTPGFLLHRLSGWGLVGLGILGFSMTAFALFDPNLAGTAAAFVLAIVLALLAVGRIFQAAGVPAPLWLRGSLASTGALILLIVVVAVSFVGLALATFAILAGIETVVTGLHPTDPRQFILLKLILFSAFYGLVLINWIDLFGKSVPGYGIWLMLTYFAPFAVLMVFEGWRSWPLAASLGLMVSLMNDVGYYFMGNLLFGFHHELANWILGQLGFLGNQTVTYFDGVTFTLTVTSWMMGLTIYARIAVVALILLYWWRHPGEIVARTETGVPGTPA